MASAAFGVASYVTADSIDQKLELRAIEAHRLGVAGLVLKPSFVLWPIAQEPVVSSGQKDPAFRSDHVDWRAWYRVAWLILAK